MMEVTEPNLNETAPSNPTLPELELPPPPLWVARFVRWLRIGFALFVLASLASGLVGCAAQASVPWQPANRVLSDRILEEVIKVTASVPAGEVSALKQGMRAWAVPGKQGQLVVLNYNTPNLCGAAGCLYSGLWAQTKDDAKLVFSSYFKPEVPKSVRLFEVVQTPDSAAKPVPCIVVSQVEARDLRQSTLCLQGDQYEVTGSTVTPIKE